MKLTHPWHATERQQERIIKTDNERFREYDRVKESSTLNVDGNSPLYEKRCGRLRGPEPTRAVGAHRILRCEPPFANETVYVRTACLQADININLAELRLGWPERMGVLVIT